MVVLAAAVSELASAAVMVNMTSEVTVTSPESSVEEAEMTGSEEDADAVGPATTTSDEHAVTKADSVAVAVTVSETETTPAVPVAIALVETGEPVAIVIAASVPLKYRTISTSVPFG